MVVSDVANNIEWSTATYLPTVVDPADISGDYEGLSQGEVGVWLGSDGANILYGDKQQMIAWGVAFLNAVSEAVPVPDPLDGKLIAVHNKDMHGKGWSPEEGVDWDVPSVHTTAVWQDILNCSVEEFAAMAPWMIVFVVDPDEAEEIGYDWQDDAIGALR